MKLINKLGRVVEINPRYESYFLKQGFKKIEDEITTVKEIEPEITDAPKKRGRKPKVQE